MQNFIVLGYIPGTQIQITFQGWLAIIATTALLYLVRINLPKKEMISLLFANLSERLRLWMSEPVILQ